MDNSEIEQVVIAVPGLLTSEEKSRVERIEEIQGVKLFKANYSNIELNGNTILCKFSLEKSREKLEEVFMEALTHKSQDARLGVIASSMGAAAFDYYLAENKLPLDWYISLSPFSKVHPALVPFVQGHFLENLDIDISSEYDKERGLRRLISTASIPDILSIDCPKILDGRNFRGNVLTLYGERDDRADVNAIVKRHKVLGGKDEDLIAYNSLHSIPYEESINQVLKFINRITYQESLIEVA